MCKKGIQWTTYDKNKWALNISQCHSIFKKGIQWTTYDKNKRALNISKCHSVLEGYSVDDLL